MAVLCSCTARTSAPVALPDAGDAGNNDGNVVPDGGSDGGVALSVAPLRRDHIGLYRPSTAQFFLKGERPGWIGDDAGADTNFSLGDANWTPLWETGTVTV